MQNLLHLALSTPHARTNHVPFARVVLIAQPRQIALGELNE
jgi:hypothetical protein